MQTDNVLNNLQEPKKMEKQKFAKISILFLFVVRKQKLRFLLGRFFLCFLFLNLTSLLISQNDNPLLKKADYLKRTGQRTASWELLQQAEKAAKTENDEELLADVMDQQAEWYSYYMYYDSAFVKSQQALDYVKEQQINHLVPKFMYKVGNTALKLFDFENTFKYCTEAKSLAEKDQTLLISNLCDICITEATAIYYHESGIRMHRKILSTTKEGLDALMAVRDTSHYIEKFARYIDMYRGIGTLDTFSMLIKNFEDILEQFPSLRYEITLSTMKALYASFSGDEEESLRYLEKSLAASKKMELPKLIQHYYVRLHTHYFEQGNYNKALVLLDSANAIKPKLFHSGADFYAKIYEKKGDYKKAFEYMESWMEQKDSILQLDRLSEMTEWETKYETQTKELKLQQQKSQRNLLLSVLGAILISGLFLLRAYRIKQRSNQELELQKSVIEEQAEELRTLDKLKSRFFANVSHELRTPLTLILGPITSALERNKLDNRDFTFMKLAQQNAKQLLLLVNSILDFSRMEAGKLELDEKPVALYPLMQRLVAQYESNADFHEISLQFKYEADPYLQVRLDISKFETIVNNLVSNALKFTSKKGSVTVGMKDLRNKLELQVQDTGRGIHKDDLPHIFERFYQTKKADAKTEGGSGIGLALCREFANLFGGILRAESILGEGSTFYFNFPKKEIMGVASEAPNESNPGVAEIPKPKLQLQHLEMPLPVNSKQLPRLLLVEDNPSLRAYIQTILSEHYQITTAENGQVAWKMLTMDGNSEDNFHPSSTVHRPPSLIISDVMMPVMDGFELLEKVRTHPTLKLIPIMLLTARADIQDKLKALRIGVDDYLVKPFEAIELTARIDNLLRNHEERQFAINNRIEEEDTTKSDENVEQAETESPKWLANLEQVLEAQLADAHFSIDHISEQIGMSRRNFFRQMKEHTGLTPNQYLREFRLQKARQLIETRQCKSVKELCYAVGFLKVSYFSELFKKRFGKNPSEYLSLF